MSMDSLQRLLRPKHIAVVGGELAAEVIRQCDKIGFGGEIWPVHPHREAMEGRRCYPTISALPDSPDATFIGVDRHVTLDVVAALAERGAGGAVCYASGFAELGGDGVHLQETLQTVMGDLAVVGPNCYGILNYLDGVTLWPDENGGQRLAKGVAIIAQSGNIGISLSMQQRSVPLAYLISTGNQAGVTIPDYIEALLEDDRVTAIGIHMEGLSDVAAFSRAAIKALERKVPIVVIKSGASELGSQMAMSHTSSLAGADDLYNALFERVGVLRTKTLPEFLESLKFLSIVGTLPSNKIASISCSGGEAALVADRATALELPFPPLIEQQRQGLADVLGDRVTLANPLDYHTYIWDNEEAQYRCFSAMLQGEQEITLKILDYPRADVCNDATWVKTARAFSRAIEAQNARGVLVSTLQENLPLEARELLASQGIAPIQGLDECLIAIRGAAQIDQAQQNVANLRPITPAMQNEGTIVLLDEMQSKQQLQKYDVPVPHSARCTADTAVETAQSIGFPVVIKVLSDTILHKSDVGGVHINLATPAAVEQAISAMQGLGDHFLVEAMAPRPVAELIVGLTRDPQFGLALVIGAGGILVELFQDSATRLLPLDGRAIDEALDSLKIAPLLNGYRGQPAGDRAALINAILGVARFAEDHAADIIEVDINPLFVLPVGQGVVAVDAVMRRVKSKNQKMIGQAGDRSYYQEG
ncbi:MAG: acetate--CoA ligase family protein [Chloroflexota bacterium]